MDHSTRPDAITGASLAALAVTAMALVFFGNADMAFVPVLQVTSYRWALYALIVVMIALWVEFLFARFRGPPDDEGKRPGVALTFSPAASEAGRRWSRRLWLAGLSLAVVTAVLLAVCGALIRRAVAVPLDAVELGLVIFAWPAACLLVLSALMRRAWIRI